MQEPCEGMEQEGGSLLRKVQVLAGTSLRGCIQTQGKGCLRDESQVIFPVCLTLTGRRETSNVEIKNA